MPQAVHELLTEWPQVQPLFRWRLRLDEREITLCLLDLDAPDVAEDLLDAAERARASRFRQEIHARRYRRGRTLMRSVLAELSAQPPQSLRIDEGPHGKPQLAPLPPGAGPAWHFNLSHSGPWALLAAWQGSPLGVDLEVLDHGKQDGLDEGDAALARRVMTAAEHAEFSLTPPGERAHAFLRTWTRKEACLKALGVGFQLEPHRLSLHAQPSALWPRGEARVDALSPAAPAHPAAAHPGPIHWVDLRLPSGCPLVAACAWLPD